MIPQFRGQGHQQGQNVIEYLILLVSCIVVFLVFLNPSGLFKNQMETIVNQTVNQLEDMASNVALPK